MTIRRILYIFAIALALGAGGWLVFAPKPILIEVATARNENFVATITEDGRTRIRDRFRISAPLAGRLSRISLRVGDAIKVGQVIAVLHPTLPPLINPRTRQELEERVGTAEANVAEAKAAQERFRIIRDKAKSSLDRAQRLSKRGVVSASNLDDAAFAYKAADRDLTAAVMRFHAAEHSLAASKAALRRTVGKNGASNERLPVASPVNGHILRVFQESAATVTAGTPLVEIGKPDDLEIIVDLLTTDAVRVKEGATVTIENWGGTPALKGRVRRIEPSAFTKVSALGVDEQRVWVIIDIVSPHKNWTRLADGFRVEAQIVIDQIANATTIPVGALFRRGEKWFVFVVADGVARLRQVSLRIRSGQKAVIADGLKDGETVALYPPSALSDGKKVKVDGT